MWQPDGRLMTVGCNRIEPLPLSDLVFFFFVEVNAHFIKHCLINRHSFTRIYLFLVTALQRNSDLCIPRKGTVRPQSQFPHSCVCERFIYSHGWSTYFPAAEEADRSWEYINRTQKHDCRNWDCGHVVPFLGLYVSNFG